MEASALQEAGYFQDLPEPKNDERSQGEPVGLVLVPVKMGVDWVQTSRSGTIIDFNYKQHHVFLDGVEFLFN